MASHALHVQAGARACGMQRRSTVRTIAALLAAGAVKCGGSLLQHGMRHHRAAVSCCLLMAGGWPHFGQRHGLSARQRDTRPSSSRDPDAFGHPSRRVTDIILVLNAAVYVIDHLLTSQALTIIGAQYAPAIAKGQYWRLFTPALLHANITHIAMNSISLNNVGPLVERLTGQPRFIAVYIASALAGSIASCAFGPPNALSVGASGAVFGLMGATGVFFWRHRRFRGINAKAVLNSLQTTILFNLGMGLMMRGIDNWGHMGGLVGGALAAFLLGPRLVQLPSGKLQDRPLLPILPGS